MRVHTKFNGELSFQVWGAESLDKDGTPLPGAVPKQETPFQPQIITDAFFETWLNGGSASNVLFGYCGVGNGTTAATAADTTISQVGTRFALFTGDYAYSTTGSTITQTVGFRTTQGQIIGTISEVGLFSASTGGQTMMRSLIKDGGGTPTTLTLTSMDFLYVRWRVTSTVNLSDVTGTVSIGGVSYNYTLRPSYWNSLPSVGYTTTHIFLPCSHNSVAGYLAVSACEAFSTQTLGSVTSKPGGSVYVGTAFSTNTYTASSKQRKLTYKWDITQGNTGSGIGSVAVHSSVFGNVGYQISFAAVSGGATIPKDNTKEFTIGITFSFGR